MLINCKFTITLLTQSVEQKTKSNLSRMSAESKWKFCLHLMQWLAKGEVYNSGCCAFERAASCSEKLASLSFPVLESCEFYWNFWSFWFPGELLVLFIEHLRLFCSDICVKWILLKTNKSFRLKILKRRYIAYFNILKRVLMTQKSSFILKTSSLMSFLCLKIIKICIKHLVN